MKYLLTVSLDKKKIDAFQQDIYIYTSLALILILASCCLLLYLIFIYFLLTTVKAR